MPVTASSFELEPHAQADGHRTCHETHVLATGDEIALHYTLPPDVDPAPIVTARAAILNEQLADDEASANFSRNGPLNLNEITPGQFAARIRQRFREASDVDQCRLCHWLTQQIAAGHVTDAQCRTAFGMTSAQWTSFKTAKVTPRANAWATVLAATAE